MTTFLVCLALFKCVSPGISNFLFAAYKGFPREDQVRWNSKVVSQCFAVLMSTVGTYGVLFDEPMNLDPIWGFSLLANVGCGIICGFMLADLYIDAFLEPNILYQRVFAGHHIISAIAAVSVAAYQIHAYFIFYGLVSEASTIFANLCWFLKLLGYSKTSKPSIVCAVIFTMMFFLTRIANVPHDWYFYYIASQTVARPPLYLSVCSCLMVALLNVLNSVWFYFIVNGLVKILRDSAKEKTTKKEE